MIYLHDTAAAKSPRLKFRLRTLFVVVTLAAILFGGLSWYVRHTIQQMKQAEQQARQAQEQAIRAARAAESNARP